MAGLSLLGLLTGIALAETRTIRATGEYRMGDNDTRADAKRLALLDAKRLALEQVGTYVESITEVRDMRLSRDEIRAYTAGLVKVTETKTYSSMDGETLVVHVDVACEIDATEVPRQVAAVKKNAAASMQLETLRKEIDHLRRQVQEQNRALEQARTKEEAQTLGAERRRTLDAVDVRSLLSQAWTALAGPGGSRKTGSSSQAGRQEARRLLDRVLDADPQNADARYQIAYLATEEGDYAGAIRAYQDLIRTNPDFVWAHYGLALALNEVGDVDGAIREFRAAVRLKPGELPLRSLLAITLSRKHDYDAAIHEYREILRLKPDDAKAYLGIGGALLNKGDHDGAIREFRAALRLQPDTDQAISAHLGLGEALGAKGGIEDAMGEYREAARIEPRLTLGLGDMLRERGDRDGAMYMYREALRFQPDSVEVRDRIRALGGTP
ncbi:MAG: tetratricopeptide repeat protein [Deltaproteobacteria bacterium]|nr:tetratricopeptide repeat protein [Deltaproteobacteria bacterium]